MIQGVESIRLLVDIVLILFAALGVGYIVSKLKQPVILGYLIAGIMIGPFALGLIGKPAEVHTLAQLGIILLLFVVGLEFSPRTLKKIWKISVFGGILEMVSMFLLGFGVGMLFDLGFTQSVFIGAIISVSSTVIIISVLQNLGEERELGGRIMIGILMVEDAGVIVIVTLLSNLFLAQGAGLGSTLFKVLLSLAFVAAMLVVGKTVLPKIVETVSRHENKKLFILTMLVISTGTATVAYLLGIPLALGSFLAGLVMAESRYGEEIVNKIRPLRNIFMIIFFVSIGMSINLFLVGNNLYFVVIFILLMIGGKFTVLLISTKMFGYTTKTGFKVGLGMIQIGEFSFVIAELGYRSGLISPTLYSSAITAALVTIIITPYSIRNSGRVYEWFRQFESLSKIANRVFPEGKERTEIGRKRELKDHTVLIGYGRVGHLTV
ncbi:MAG: cation:proton antiporter, partial [Candidatus Thermoplasmatota archaeon]